MQRVSKTNTYSASDGTRYTSAQIDRRAREACKELFRIQYETYGYNFCEECKVNDRNAILDPSHDKSVDWCKKNGRVELAWYFTNLTIRCRECHRKHDKL